MLYLFSLIKKKCLKHKRRLIFADIELTVIKKQCHLILALFKKAATMFNNNITITIKYPCFKCVKNATVIY